MCRAMGRLDHVFQRVVERITGCDALKTAQVFAPGYVGRFVEGIAGRAHLHENGVHAHGLHHVQQAVEFHFLAVRRQTGLGRPVDIPHGGDPGAAHFGYRLLLRSGGPSEQK